MKSTSICAAVNDFLAKHGGSFRGSGASGKVIVLGLDGGSLEVLSPFIEDGLMPNLKQVIENGSSGVLTSTIVPITSLAWPAALSGKNPGKLGTFTFRKRKKDSYKLRTINASDVGSCMVWDILSRKGRTCCVLNVPITWPPRQLNGVMVNSWEAPSPSQAVITHPPELTDSLNKSGYSTAGPWHRIEYVQSNFMQLLELSWTLVKVGWDFFMVVFHQIDTLSHFHYGNTQRWKNILKKLDDGIGELLAFADDRTSVVVFSDHGTRYYKRIFSLSRWLNEQGYMHSRKIASGSLRTKIKRIAGKSPVLKAAVKKVCRKLMPNRESTSSGTDLSAFVDWERSRVYAYEYTSANYGAIRVNLKGREPEGMVSSGSEYDTLLSEIREGLLRIRDGADNVVLKVYRRDELYSGDRVEDLPDIVFELKDGYMVNANLPDVNKTMFFDNPKRFYAAHTIDGMVVLKGRNIVRGKSISANIADIAPTILYLMGLPAPCDMDGRVMMQAIKEEYARRNPPKKEDVVVNAGAGASSASSGEHEDQLRAKLSSLGYID